MERIASVDIFRFLAIASVIVIHTHYSNTHNLDIASVAEDQFPRFAVPFFFAISGYFWGLKIRNADSPTPASISMAKRILFLFLAWSAIYLFPFKYVPDIANPVLMVKGAYWNVVNLAAHPLTLIMEGTKVHLWFLMGLLCSIATCLILVKYNRIKTLVALSILLYAMGLLAKAYSPTPLGIHTTFNTRDGPFFGTIFFVSGYILSGLKPDESWLGKGLLIMGFGFAMHFTELYLLWRYYGQSPLQDYVIGTYFMGIGAAMVALSNHPLLRLEMFSGLGRLTLGIYAIHFAFVDMLSQGFKSLPWELLSLAVLFLSVTTAMILSRNSITRRLVM